jgi:hypothetical protein
METYDDDLSRFEAARCLGRHAKDYARLSATPDQFKEFAEAVNLMM